MREVIISNPKNDSFGAQLLSLYEALKDAQAQEKLIFNFSKLKWACPSLILPLSAYIRETGSSYNFVDSPIKSYFDAINFPRGINTISQFEAEERKNRTYTPISVLEKDEKEKRERLETLFQEMVYKILGANESAKNAIYYPISELVTNIFEHSKKNRGFIFGQFYPQKKCVDICIADRGRGAAGAYLEEKGLRLSDEDAIREVMVGHSTKPNTGRGYGVRTSKRVVCEGLNGSFMLISGTAALVSNGTQEILTSLPDFYWPGVIVAYRIRRPKQPIDISRLIE